MYSMSLVGSLGFLFYMRQYIPGDYERTMFFVCATIWGLATVGFPLGLFSQSRSELDCSRHCSRFIFLGFSLLVLYMMYRMMLPAPPSSDTHRAPSASPTPASSADSVIGWTIAYIFLAVVVMAGHLVVWALACCRGDDRDDVDSDEEQEVWTDLTVRVTGVWTGFTARVNGVIDDWLAWLAEKLKIIDLPDGFDFDLDDDFDLLAGR